jgi:hypothetical protein
MINLQDQTKEFGLSIPYKSTDADPRYLKELSNPNSLLQYDMETINFLMIMALMSLACI